ncbi:hypothetical protein [Streptomyces hydrogenans]
MRTLHAAGLCADTAPVIMQSRTDTMREAVLLASDAPESAVGGEGTVPADTGARLALGAAAPPPTGA